LGDYNFTGTAKLTIFRQLGMVIEEAIGVILSLTPKDLYKSMTSHSNHTIWQDVYKKDWENNKLYIKLQIVNEETIIISFKLDNEW
jgi:motility quorum-sensing regulator/GCU-specific mRNA interferase toxin